LKAHSCAGLMNSYAMFAQCLNFAKANGYEKIYVKDIRTDIFKPQVFESAQIIFDFQKTGKFHGIDIVSEKTLLPDLENEMVKSPWNVDFDCLRVENVFFAKNLLQKVEEDFKNYFLPNYTKSRWQDSGIVLHLKVGRDSLTHYSKVHGCNKQLFEKTIRMVYRKIIDKHVTSDSSVYICINDKRDSLVKYVEKKCKSVFVYSPDEKRREIKAALELLMVKNYFADASLAVLPVNIQKNSGSTFSTFLFHHCNFKNLLEIDQDDFENLKKKC
jgi:hypothetical protein